MADVRDGLTSRELTEWAAYERVTGPLGADRLDVLFALLCATIVNSQPRRRGQPKAQVSDFLIPWDGRPPEQDPMTMRRNLYASVRGTR